MSKCEWVRNGLLSTFTKHGNIVIYDCIGVNALRENEIVATGRLNGPPYVMNMRVCVPESPVLSNLATTEDQLQRWHE